MIGRLRKILVGSDSRGASNFASDDRFPELDQENAKEWGKSRAIEIAKKYCIDSIMVQTTICRSINMMDYGCLAFGNACKVSRDFEPNRRGDVRKGEQLIFLGYYVFPYDNGLRLHFENPSGERIDLEFEGNFPEVEGRVRYINQNETVDYFDDSFCSFTPRQIELAEARAEIFLAGGIVEFARYGASGDFSASADWKPQRRSEILSEVVRSVT